MSERLDWAASQLDRAGYRLTNNNSRIRAVCDAALDAADMVSADPQDVEIIMDLLAHLLRGRAIVVEEEPSAEGRWVPFALGDFISGTRVRIRRDAYGPGIGERFNGKLGYFTAARNGQALVKMDEETSEEFASRHEPDKLEAYVIDAIQH